MHIIIVYITITLSTGNLKFHNLLRTLKFALFIKLLIIFFVKIYFCLIPCAMWLVKFVILTEIGIAQKALKVHDFVLGASVQFYSTLDKTYHKFSNNLKNNEKSYKYCFY
jgi:hypothetical protein